MTQPAPSYQPYQPLPPMMGMAAPPKPSGGGLTSLIAGILALLTAGLAVGGSFAPISKYHDTFAAGDFSGTEVNSDLSWWNVNGAARLAPFDEGGKLFGLSLVLVATLLVLGAVFAFVASRTRSTGATTGGRSLITAGVGVLAGVVLLQSLLVLEEAATYNDRELQPGESLEFSPGLGLVLPLCALVLGVVAVVLAHVGQRQREFRVEPSTPRMGFPAPYGYQHGAPGNRSMPSMPAVGAPAAPAAPPAERPAEAEQASADEWAEAADDSSETTQVVAGATASGEDAEAAPSSEAPEAVTPPEPVTPPAPVTPATTTPPAPEPPATPEQSDSPAAEPAPAAPETPAEPASPPAPAAETESTEPAPLSDLPAAPPAPELAEEDRK